MIEFDLARFAPEAVSEETAKFNRELRETLSKVPPTHKVPVELTRQAREEGRGVFPPNGPLEGSDWREIPGGGRVRVSLPAGAPKGVYLHIHGGGWAIGSPKYSDGQNQRLAREAQAAVVSIEYRLAPEHPFPAGPDDCFRAAKWVLEALPFGDLPHVIGGESAGGHLSAVTLLRLREAGLMGRMRGAVLNYGCFDLRMTASARNWGETNLILSTPTIAWFADCCTPDPAMREDPMVSPLLADLAGMPPALFQVGTQDPLLDDTLMMAARWAAAGAEAELAVHPGGVHAFDQFGLEIAEDYLRRKSAFVRARFG